MTFTEHFLQLCHEDPITVFVTGLALSALGLAALTRRGGVDTSLIIQLFGNFATLGTLLKCIDWGLKQSVQAETTSYRPSGTDFVLLAGMVVAAVWSNFGSLFSLLTGSITQNSLIERAQFWIGSGPPFVPEWVVHRLGVQAPPVSEDEEALRARTSSTRDSPSKPHD